MVYIYRNKVKKADFNRSRHKFRIILLLKHKALIVEKSDRYRNTRESSDKY